MYVSVTDDTYKSEAAARIPAPVVPPALRNRNVRPFSVSRGSPCVRPIRTLPRG